MAYSNYSDEQLMKLISEQDVAAFEHLYDQYAQIVFNLVVRIVRDTSIAEEIVQETFWQAWKKAAEFRSTSSAATWIHRIARNKSIDSIRRRHTITQCESLPTSDNLLTPHDDHAISGVGTAQLQTTQLSIVETSIAYQTNQQQLQNALKIIPDEQRICLEFAYFDGMTQQEIAKHLDLPLGTIKTRLRIGLSKLEYILRAVGYVGI